jgi:hypothetical protein
MNAIPPEFDAQSRPRQLARLSIAAAFLSCTMNCVFSQLASRTGSQLGAHGWLVDWTSLAVVLTGLVLGGIGLAGGWRRGSRDTVAIAAIGLVLNLGIVFLIVWYFAVVRPTITRLTMELDVRREDDFQFPMAARGSRSCAGL